MSDFVSLTVSLDGWFDKPISKLPKGLRKRVEGAFQLISWDVLSAEQRQYRAAEWDSENDPAMEGERQRGWDLGVEQQDIERRIDQLERMAATTPTELESQERQLAELRKKLESIERQQRNARSAPRLPATPRSAERYIAYPKAMAMLRDRLNATPDELAAWVFDGPENDGLAAYRNANELDPPPRFYYGYSYGSADDFDYLAPLMGCWFLRDDIAGFQPVEHYITGKELIERWSKYPDIRPEAFIRARIAESRLLDGHPIYGLTQGTNPEDPSSPPIASALFALSYVEAIEAEDFGSDLGEKPEKCISSPKAPPVGSREWRSQNARAAANAKHNKVGGSRDKQEQIRKIWASGKYSTRELCAEEEYEALGMSFAAARKALRNTTDPDPSKT